jgi:hypothetical protein
MAEIELSTLSETPKDGFSSVTGSQEEQVFTFTEDRKLGFISVVSLIVNSMIGTGIFSTPSDVFSVVNSVGSALMLWLTGAILTLCGFVDVSLSLITVLWFTLNMVSRFPSLVEIRITYACILRSDYSLNECIDALRV